MAGFADPYYALTVPPGSKNSFFVAGGQPPATIPITVNPITQKPLSVPVKPVLSPTPTPVTSQEVVPVIIAEVRTYSATIKEGIRAEGGDLPVYSTGALSAATIVNGASGSGIWANPSNAITADGAVATCVTSGAGYTGQLKVSGFAFNLPAGAVISGVKATVTRSKV